MPLRERLLRFAFLINPISGRGEGKRLSLKIPEVLKRISILPNDFCLEFTQPGETVFQAKRLAKVAENLVVAGGDGTVSQAIAGAYQSGDPPPIGIIPIGIGNDLARTLKVYELFKKQGLEGCILQFLNHYTTPFDLWKVNKKEYLINYLGIGFDARIVHSFSQKRHLCSFSSVLLNQSVYGLMGIAYCLSRIAGKAGLSYWTEKQKKHLDLTHHSLVVISNIPLYAGGALLNPEGDWADGMIEIIPFPGVTAVIKFFLAKKIFKFLAGDGGKIKSYQANKIEILVPSGNYLQIDGEDKTHLLKENRLEIEWEGQVLLLAGDKLEAHL